MHKDTRKTLRDLRSDILDPAVTRERRWREVMEIRKELSRLEKLAGEQIARIVEEQEPVGPSGEEG